jgi:predicted membrane protein
MYISDLTNSTVGGSETTCDHEPLVLRVAAILSALLIITVIFLILITITFTVVTIKLSRDKINLKRTIKAMPLEQEQDVTPRSSTREKEQLQATNSADYEYVDVYKVSDMNINENAAYSTITDL